MKKWLIASFLGCLALVLLRTASAEPNYPEPVGFVNDFANIIPDDIQAQLETTLRDYETKTTNEIVVVTVPSLEGTNIESYTIGLARKWGVGKEGKDNGVVLLVAPNEHEVRIEVGYGLEGVLPDGKAGEIVRKDIIPRFKEEKMAEGVIAGANAIMLRIDSASANPEPTNNTEGGGNGGVLAGIIIGVIFGSLLILATVVWIIRSIAHAVQKWNAERKRKEHVRKETREGVNAVEENLKKALVRFQQMSEVSNE